MPTLSTTQIGQQLPEHTRTPTAIDLFSFSAAVWRTERSHYDRAPSKEDGDLVVQSDLRADWMSQCVVDWLGEEGTLLEFTYEEREVARLGPSYTVGGRVTDVAPDTGEVRLELEVLCDTASVVSAGSARVRLS